MSIEKTTVDKLIEKYGAKTLLVIGAVIFVLSNLGQGVLSAMRSDELGKLIEKERNEKQAIIKQQERFDAERRANDYVGELHLRSHIKSLYTLPESEEIIINAQLPNEFEKRVRKFDEDTKW